MIVRELTAIEEFESCLELQRQGFGWNDLDLMPVRFFVVSHHIGGLVLGAFEGGRLIGFSSAIPGIRNGSPYWHSHMLAVAEGLRDAGVGAALKFRQRDEALARGIRSIEWTFSPTQSRNAYFNLEKLGVVVRRYYPNLYGIAGRAGTFGLESDRVIAEWYLGQPRRLVTGDVRRVTIPADASSLRNADPAAAKALQQRVRSEFLTNLRDGFVAVAFERKGDSGDYIFVRGESGAHLPG